jgi:hypothetical protein
MSNQFHKFPRTLDGYGYENGNFTTVTAPARH